MSTPRLCPTCLHPNSDTAEVCEHCGAALPPLRVETVRFGDLPEVTAAQRKTTYPGKTFPGFLAVYIMDEVNPLMFEDKGTLILGRSVLGEAPPTINLTQHHAGLLGVSRRHAAIHVSDHEHTITDLNSSNGTWVNQEPLVPGKARPLRSGDSIRLGHLVLHIYFEEVASNGEAKAADHPAPVKPPTSEFGEVSAVTIRLVGRPGPVEYRSGQVTLRLLHLPTPPDMPEETTALPVVPTRFTVQMSSDQWFRVRDGLTEPETTLVVEGTCTYGKENMGILVQAAQVSLQRPAAPEPPTASQPTTAPADAPPASPDLAAGETPRSP